MPKNYLQRGAARIEYSGGIFWEQQMDGVKNSEIKKNNVSRGAAEVAEIKSSEIKKNMSHAESRSARRFWNHRDES